MTSQDNWLDYLSARDVVAQSSQEALVDALVRWLARIVLTVAMVYLMVGFGPLVKSDGQSAEGGALRQVFFMLLACLSLPLILVAWRRALAILARCWALLLVYAGMISTVFWSAFPGITVRRFIVYVIVLMIGLGVASVLRSPRQYFPPVIAAFAFVLFANFLYTAAVPGKAWSDIGLQAMHTSKNVAGMVTQGMAITFASALLAVRNPLGFWSLVGLTVLSLVFLALTLSKTALALVLLCVVVLLPIYMLIWTSRVLAMLAVAGLALIAGLVVFSTGTFNLSGPDWAEILTGDPTFTARDQLWGAGVQHIGKHPWFGYGWGAQWSMLPVYHPLWNYIGFWTGIEARYLSLRQFHNGYLDIMVNGGVYFAVIVAIYGIDLVRKIVSAIVRRSPDRWQFAGSAWLAVYFVSVLVSNMMESSLFYPDMFLGQFLVFLTLAHTSWQMGERD
ncbi:O-antigen ligase family protein [Acuticoccus mangrovi]|uniref:O-antigen ligase family protein n=1 Tax=Acuticoccus mangrovi TaxID=2796142 RepID=A0A934IMG9_9HYPH|nr:O-antigen ligase family protein [Acuticoccus mangrovi]MBJ3774114.1 O-antigen ligase family protein [Acuticoccus mangrovi]